LAGVITACHWVMGMDCHTTTHLVAACLELCTLAPQLRTQAWYHLPVRGMSVRCGSVPPTHGACRRPLNKHSPGTAIMQQWGWKQGQPVGQPAEGGVMSPVAPFDISSGAGLRPYGSACQHAACQSCAPLLPPSPARSGVILIHGDHLRLLDHRDVPTCGQSRGCHPRSKGQAYMQHRLTAPQALSVRESDRALHPVCLQLSLLTVCACL
jgi:hypothetical protein